MVLGRRSLQAGFQPGIWQLPPAGNVDASAVGADGCIDLRRHALRELEEELGVRPDQIAAMQPICLIEHPGSHVLDLGFCIDLRLDAAALLAAHAAAHDAAEYDPLTVVPWDRLAARLTELGETLMPTAFLFLDHLTQSAGQPLHRLDQLSFGQAADGDAAAREP
jgi:8-oxo-dGTP pyrophosphatase MutT (NUDIX family)